MTGTTRRPDAAAISAAAPSTYFGVSALSATSAPASASTSAIPLPMPRPAPVMKTTFPVTSNSAGIMTHAPLFIRDGRSERLILLWPSETHNRIGSDEPQ